MSKSPPIKHKCVDCGHEEWLVLYECCCYDICSCGSPKCTKCGHIDKENRNIEKSQSKFICQKCEFETNADYNAALNISRSKDIIKEYLITK